MAIEDPADPGSEVVFGATIGLALLRGPFTFRGTLSALGPNRYGAGGALGFGVAIRGGDPSSPE